MRTSHSAYLYLSALCLPKLQSKTNHREKCDSSLGSGLDGGKEGFPSGCHRCTPPMATFHGHFTQNPLQGRRPELFDELFNTK